jgi:hypothetical protein
MNLILALFSAGSRRSGCFAGGEFGVAWETTLSGARNKDREWYMSGSPFSDAYRRTQRVLIS